MLVYLGLRDIKKCLDSEVIVLLNPVGFCKRFKLAKRNWKLTVVAQIKMCIQQIVQPFNVMTCFHANHKRFYIEQVNPFLCVTIILQKVLSYESIPCVTLV